MVTALGKIVADFSTSLAASVSATATTATIQSVTDDDGNTIANGTYYFAIDADNSQKEFIKCTVTGTSLSSISTVTRQGSTSSGFARAHRVGASVTLTDFAQIKLLTDLLTGATDLDSSDPLKYDGTATISDANHLATKAYVDAVAIAGASDASTTVKGIVEIATQAEIEAATGTGATGAVLAVPASGNGARWFAGYAADAGANDTYAITLSPAPTAYTTGMVVAFKANTANTGACTINVNSLGAKSLKVNKAYDPRNNYIVANSLVVLEYDGTNFQVLSVSAQPQVSQDGGEIYAADAGANDTYAVTLAPAPTAYATGMVVRFKANTLNTGAATLNVNSLGAVTIKKHGNSDLDTGDILANQIIEVIHDGTNFQLISPPAALTSFKTGQTTRDLSSATGDQNIAHGLGRTPKFVRISAMAFPQGGVNTFATTAFATYDGTNTGYVTLNVDDGNNARISTTFIIGNNGNNRNTMTLSFDATNIILSWTKSNSPTGTLYILWEAFA